MTNVDHVEGIAAKQIKGDNFVFDWGYIEIITRGRIRGDATLLVDEDQI